MILILIDLGYYTMYSSQMTQISTPKKNRASYEGTRGFLTLPEFINFFPTPSLEKISPIHYMTKVTAVEWVPQVCHFVSQSGIRMETIIYIA